MTAMSGSVLEATLRDRSQLGGTYAEKIVS